MKKLVVLVLALIAVALWAENSSFHKDHQDHHVDDNISIEDLIIDDGDEVINNQDMEKPQG